MIHYKFKFDVTQIIKKEKKYWYVTPIFLPFLKTKYYTNKEKNTKTLNGNEKKIRKQI